MRSSLEPILASSTKPGKLPYETPFFVEYGAVQNLTAGGSGATSEYKFFMGTCTKFFSQPTKNTTLC